MIINTPICFSKEINFQLLISSDTTIRINKQETLDRREKFLEYLQIPNCIVFGLTTIIGQKDHVPITDLRDYENIQLKRLLQSDFEKQLDPQLARLTLFILINNLCRYPCGISFQALSQLENLYNSGEPLKLPAENFNTAFFDATVNWHITSLIKVEQYDKIIITSMKSLSFATLLLGYMKSLQIMKAAYIVTHLSFEAQNGVIAAFTNLVNEVKQHDSQLEVAKELYELLTKDDNSSELNQSLKSVTHNILQDAYSLRCTPQVLGACLEWIKHIESFIFQSQNKNQFAYRFRCSDNANIEIVYTQENNNEEELLLIDYLAIAISEIGAIAERRIQRMINPNLVKLQDYYHEFLRASNQEIGMQQLCSMASNLIQKNKKQCYPISCDSMPQTTYLEDVNNNFEDSIEKIQELSKNTLRILAIDVFLSSRIIKVLENKAQKICYEPTRKLAEKLAQIENLSQTVEYIINFI